MNQLDIDQKAWDDAWEKARIEHKVDMLMLMKWSYGMPNLTREEAYKFYGPTQRP